MSCRGQLRGTGAQSSLTAPMRGEPTRCALNEKGKMYFMEDTKPAPNRKPGRTAKKGKGNQDGHCGGLLGFRDSVLRIVGLVPNGKVVSYGQVAMMAGSARAARQVGWVLHSLPRGTEIPWHRVVNAHGHVPSKGRELAALEQIARLRREGVPVSDDGRLDIELYRWLSHSRRTKEAPPRKAKA
jgi:methylated-DNA-protein-cysteine methyltransferase-like protein